MKSLKRLFLTLGCITALALLFSIQSFAAETKILPFTVHTADESNAGTNSTIYVTLYYTDGSHSTKQILDTPNYDDFERNDTKTYYLVAEKKEIKSVLIDYIHKDEWKPAWVSFDNKVYYIDVSEKFQEDKKYTINVKTVTTRLLDITIHTANVSGAGTDSTLAVVVHFEDGLKSQKYILDKADYDDFERNKTDTYSIAIEDKPIKKVEILFDRYDDWMPGWISFDGKVYEYNEWFKKDQSIYLTNINSTKRTFDFIICTFDGDNSGTDSSVYLRINFEDGTSTEKFLLDKDGIDDFEQRSIECYSFVIENKTVKTVDLIFDGSDAWHPYWAYFDDKAYEINENMEEPKTFTFDVNGPTYQTVNFAFTSSGNKYSSSHYIYYNILFKDGTSTNVQHFSGENSFKSGYSEYAIMTLNKEFDAIEFINGVNFTYIERIEINGVKYDVDYGMYDVGETYKILINKDGNRFINFNSKLYIEGYERFENIYLQFTYIDNTISSEITIYSTPAKVAISNKPVKEVKIKIYPHKDKITNLERFSFDNVEFVVNKEYYNNKKSHTFDISELNNNNNENSSTSQPNNAATVMGNANVTVIICVAAVLVAVAVVVVVVTKKKKNSPVTVSATADTDESNNE